jgi:hypothetical protein
MKTNNEIYFVILGTMDRSFNPSFSLCSSLHISPTFISISQTPSLFSTREGFFEGVNISAFLSYKNYKLFICFFEIPFSVDVLQCPPRIGCREKCAKFTCH